MTMSKPKRWVKPPHLEPYDKYTVHPGRAEEMINHSASVFSNPVAAVMRAELRAQYDLLERLSAAGLLRYPES